MLEAAAVPKLLRGTPIVGGWSVGQILPALEAGLVRAEAVRGDGRTAILEAGRYRGADLLRWLDEFVEEVELWADAAAFLPVLAAGRIDGADVVVRVLAEPRGTRLSDAPQPRLEVALHQAIQLARALARAHGRGLIHGALQPGRVYLLPDGVEVEPGGLAGSLGLGGNPTRADDVYDLGRLIALLVSGQERVPLPSVLPLALRDVVEACLDVDAVRRPDAPAVVAALEAVSRDRTGTEGTPSTLNRTVAPRLGVVDVTLPPAAPPAPEVRSVVPAGPRRERPEPVASEGPPLAWVGVGLLLLAVVLVLAWWLVA